MKAKYQRLIFLSLGGVVLGCATYLVVSAFEESITFFYTPTQLEQKKIPLHTRIRVGGMVEKGSINKGDLQVTFQLTDFEKEITVSYKGILPDLFKEGQGVVAEGELVSPRVFKAKTILAKHDEKYRPPSLPSKEKKSP